ncbi:MAG: hypothetical protein PHC51_10865 [bacterium]|nr:hypothetical protein [bacterium]
MEALSPLTINKIIVPEVANNGSIRNLISQLENSGIVDWDSALNQTKPMSGLCNCYCPTPGNDFAALVPIVAMLSKLTERLQQLLSREGSISTGPLFSSGDTSSGVELPDLIPGLKYSELPGAGSGQSCCTADSNVASTQSGNKISNDTAARDLVESGHGNIFSQAWKDEIAQAASGPRGLGNASDGYLAWSEEGFTYFNNPNLTVEQNKKLAEVSLVTGVAIEKTPARSEQSSAIPEINKWVNDFIQGHEKAIRRFIDNPLEGYVVRDGQKKIEMNISSETGRVTSSFSRKRGGLAGLVERNTQSIAGLADFAAISTFFMPPVAKLFGVLPAGLSRVTGLVSRLLR